MQKLIAIAALAALAGCATAPRNDAGRVSQAPADPSQWRVVSVTPVAPGTGDRVAAANNGSRIEYSAPVPVTRERVIAQQQPVYVQQQPLYVQQQPVYVPGTVYTPIPVYQPAPAYYYPPVTLSLGLGFVFGRHWSRGYGHLGGHRRWR